MTLRSRSKLHEKYDYIYTPMWMIRELSTPVLCANVCAHTLAHDIYFYLNFLPLDGISKIFIDTLMILNNTNT